MCSPSNHMTRNMQSTDWQEVKRGLCFPACHLKNIWPISSFVTMPSGKWVMGVSPVTTTGGRITGCSARPVSQQAGSRGVEVFVLLRNCVGVLWVGALSKNLLRSGALVPHWCLYDVNKGCQTYNSTVGALWSASCSVSESQRQQLRSPLWSPAHTGIHIDDTKSFGLGFTRSS